MFIRAYAAQPRRMRYILTPQKILFLMYNPCSFAKAEREMLASLRF